MFNKRFECAEGNMDFVHANMLVKNIRFALISLECIMDRQEIDFALYEDRHTYYFFHLQSLLTACGNICNVLCNEGRGNMRYRMENGRRIWLSTEIRQRSARLRRILNVNRADFDLIFQKEGRNTNEHFDERYHEIAGGVGDYNIIDENTPIFVREQIEMTPHLRTYNKIEQRYITYKLNNNGVPVRLEYDLQRLRGQLNTLLGRVVKNPIYTCGWLTEE